MDSSAPMSLRTSSSQPAKASSKPTAMSMAFAVKLVDHALETGAAHVQPDAKMLVEQDVERVPSCHSRPRPAWRRSLTSQSRQISRAARTI